MVGVDESSLQADSQPKSVGLVWECQQPLDSGYIHQMNRVNYRNDIVIMIAPWTLSWVLLFCYYCTCGQFSNGIVIDEPTANMHMGHKNVSPIFDCTCNSDFKFHSFYCDAYYAARYLSGWSRWSVRLSNTWIVTKPKKLLPKSLHHKKGQPFRFCHIKNSWWGDNLCLKFSTKLTTFLQKRRFSIDIRL